MIAHVLAAMHAFDKARPKEEAIARPVLVVCQGKECGFAFEGVEGEVCPRCHSSIGMKTGEPGGTY